MSNPWQKIFGLGVIVFFIVLLVTYSYCDGNSSCVTPLQPNLSTASTDQLQSAVTKFKRKVKKKKSILPPGPSYADPALAPSSMMPPKMAQMPVATPPAPSESVTTSDTAMAPSMPLLTPEVPPFAEPGAVAAPSMPISPPLIAESQPPPPPPSMMVDVPPAIAPTPPELYNPTTLMPTTSTITDSTIPESKAGISQTGLTPTDATVTIPPYTPPSMVYDPTMLPTASTTPPQMPTLALSSTIPPLMTNMYTYCDFESTHMDARDGAYQDKLSSSFLDKLPNIKVTGGINRYDNFVNPCHLRFLAMGLAPFQEMLKNINTKVIISRESLGPGYRAFTSIDGATVVIIAPDSYSRPMTPQEFLNLVRHEFGHVLHILWLNDAKKVEWDSLIHTGATNAQGVLSLSEYGATRGEPGRDPHVFEALAEDLLSLLLFGRDTIEVKRPEFLPVYDFLNSSFSVERFGSRRYQGSVDFDTVFPSGRDATRLIEYPLPEISHE